MKTSENALGTLYLVATPIGNPKDITLRALDTLNTAAEIYAEDTRVTQRLLSMLKIDRTALSFHDHSSQKVLEKIVASLKAGLKIAYVSDAGMPCVSDPGFTLVRAALRAGANVEALPGASAVTSFFAASNLASPKFLFHGFFPRTRGEIEKVLEEIEQMPIAHIFFESPGRVVGTFEILNKRLPEQQAVFARELTKTFEEWIRGSVEEVFAQLSSHDKIRGECVFGVVSKPKLQTKSLTVGNASEGQNTEIISETLNETQKDEIAKLVHSGLSSKDAAKLLSKKFGLSRKVIYDFIVRHLT